MAVNLTGVQAKIARAEELAHAVKYEVGLWMEQSPYRVIAQRNTDSTRHSLVARLQGKQPPLMRWTLMIGDCVHNLRCALDHLVYAIAIQESGQDPPPCENSLTFPICDIPDRFTVAAKNRLGTLSPTVRAVIESVQPYHRPQVFLPPLLTILRNLNNADKHKLLRLAFNAVIQGDLGFAGMQHPSITSVEFIPNYGEIQDGTEIAALVFDGPNPDMKFDRIELHFVVAIWHGKKDSSMPVWADRTDLAAILSLLIGEIKAVIEKVVAVAVI